MSSGSPYPLAASWRISGRPGLRWLMLSLLTHLHPRRRHPHQCPNSFEPQICSVRDISWRNLECVTYHIDDFDVVAWRLHGHLVTCLFLPSDFHVHLTRFEQFGVRQNFVGWLNESWKEGLGAFEYVWLHDSGEIWLFWGFGEETFDYLMPSVTLITLLFFHILFSSWRAK